MARLAAMRSARRRKTCGHLALVVGRAVQVGRPVDRVRRAVRHAGARPGRCRRSRRRAARASRSAEALGSRADAADGHARVGHGLAVRVERQDGGDAERGALVDAELHVGPRRAGAPGREAAPPSGSRRRGGRFHRGRARSRRAAARARPRGSRGRPGRRRRGTAWRGRCADRRTRGCRRPCPRADAHVGHVARHAGHERGVRAHGLRPLDASGGRRWRRSRCRRPRPSTRPSPGTRLTSTRTRGRTKPSFMSRSSSVPPA